MGSLITEQQRIKASKFLRENQSEWENWDGSKRQLETEKMAIRMVISRLMSDVTRLNSLLDEKECLVEAYRNALERLE